MPGVKKFTVPPTKGSPFWSKNVCSPGGSNVAATATFAKRHIDNAAVIAENTPINFLDISMAPFKPLKPAARYGRLTILRAAEPRLTKDGILSSYSMVECDCGNVKEVRNAALRRDRVRSCGCIRIEMAMENLPDSWKHGLSKKNGKPSPEYYTWQAMITRCTNPKAKGYENYGGRGITVYPEWMVSLEAFIRDMGERPSATHSLDRIDNNGNYEKSNCRWATKRVQSSNRRNNRIVRLYGEMTTITEACNRLGMDARCLREKAKRRGIIVQEFIDLHTFWRRCEISDPYHAAQTIP